VNGVDVRDLQTASLRSSVNTFCCFCVWLADSAGPVCHISLQVNGVAVLDLQKASHQCGGSAAFGLLTLLVFCFASHCR
jgi:hypothetical protein